MTRALSLYLSQWAVTLTLRQWYRSSGLDPAHINPAPNTYRNASCAISTPPTVLLLTTEGDRQLVSRFCHRAAASGVQPGMTLAHARAMLPERQIKPHPNPLQGQLQAPTGPQSHPSGPTSTPVGGSFRARSHETEPAHADSQNQPPALGDHGQRPQFDPLSGALLAFDDPDRDLRRLHQLAAWANRFSPIVAPDPPDGLLFDIAGCQRVFKGENNMVHLLLQSVGQLGFHARAAVAPTFGCAWGCARYALTDATSIIVNDDELEDAMAQLPIEALRLEQPVLDALGELSIHRVKQVMKLPRASLPSRFGPLLLHRLDQSLGRAAESITPVVVEPPVAASRFFDGPCKQLEAVCQASRMLIDEIVSQLQEREQGLGRLTMDIWRCDAPPLKLSISLSHTTRHAKHLWSLLRPELENANMGFGVDGLTLTAGRCRTLEHDQAMHWPDADESHDQAAHEQALGQWLDAMQQRLGREGVTCFQPSESHMPERAWHLRQVESIDQITGSRRKRSSSRRRSAFDDAQQRSRRKPKDAARTFGQDRQRRSAGITPASRPTVLFQPPQPVDVVAVTPQGAPCRIRHSGIMQNVRSSAGPERITGEWWRSRDEHPESGRDYYRIEDEHGTWLWVYRNHADGRWFLHGQWA